MDTLVVLKRIMTSNQGLDSYKQAIAELYNRRSATYDEGEWHPRIAHRLVEYAKIQPGQKVLDIATGTGMVALEAAQRVGITGQTLGIDISTGMLEQATRKANLLGLDWLQFQLADAEALDFPQNTFDLILCSSAFIWMSDLVGALRNWYNLLKPGGRVGFHAFAETSFIGGTIAQRVAERHGIAYLMNKPTGTVEKCHNLMAAAGYEAIEITTEEDGSGYISLEAAQQLWTGNPPAPGQPQNPLSHLSPEELAQFKAEFDAELAALNRPQGVWNEVKVFYVFGQKPLVKIP